MIGVGHGYPFRAHTHDTHCTQEFFRSAVQCLY